MTPTESTTSPGLRPRSILMMSLHGYVAGEPELGLPDTGGQVVFVLELAKQFAALGHRVDVVTRRFEDQPEVDQMDHNLRVWRIPFGGNEFVRKEDMHDHLGEFVTRFTKAISDDDISYDVINSHYWDAGWAGQQIAEELEIPHVHTPHSLGWWKRKDMGGDPVEAERQYRFEERIRKEYLIYRRADGVIATTPQQVEHIQKKYELPEDQLTMIPPGIDERKYTPVPTRRMKEIRKRLGLQPHDIYTVGRAAKNKGYDLLIRALPLLRDAVPDARYVLAVGAEADKDVRKVAKWKHLATDLAVSGSIDWRGYVSDDDMADYYRGAGAFALPSRYEPFGMTAVEAMACGTPCIITIHGGLEEMFDFGSQALFADPKRPAELATMLSMPLRYPRLRERLSVDGARWARRTFGWRRIARRTLAVFDRYTDRYADV